MRNEGGKWETYEEESGWGGDMQSGKMVGYAFACVVGVGSATTYDTYKHTSTANGIRLKHPAGL